MASKYESSGPHAHSIDRLTLLDTETSNVTIVHRSDFANSGRGKENGNGCVYNIMCKIIHTCTLIIILYKLLYLYKLTKHIFK